jgi:ABC-type Fe3+-hydroxamate transport system substrate-binding protein
MITSTDQTGRQIILKQHPARIVSVVPSQTELLFDLALGNEVVGITKFCVHPPEALKTKTVVGGTKNLNIEKIRSLKPDLILANKEENTRQQIDELVQEFPVWVSDVKTLDDAFAMIESTGELTDKISQANAVIQKITSGFAQLQTSNLKSQTITCAYLIWHQHIMSIGNDTFIHDMLHRCRFENVFSSSTRYPEISSIELSAANPEIIFLSSEPFPFSEKHIAYYQRICPAAKIILVDGQMFSWYGSRLQYAPEYFLRLIHALNNIA